MKLITAEGFEFVVNKKPIVVSQTVRNMLISPFFFFFSLFFPHSLTLMSIAITRIFLPFVGAQIASRRRSTAGDFSGGHDSYPRGQCFYWSLE